MSAYYLVHQSRAAHWAVCGSRINLVVRAESEQGAVEAWERYVADHPTQHGCDSQLIRLLDARGQELRVFDSVSQSRANVTG